MKRIDENVFVVKEIRDTGHNPVIARFKTEKEARKLVPLVDGHGGEIQAERIELVIFDTFEEYMDTQKDSLKKSALGKLTKEERFALGL
jgi:hypothetical protein